MIRQVKLPQLKIDRKILRSFQNDLLIWFHQYQRALPWRSLSSPYRTVVSEFMCQQTQIATVLPYFERWMQSFPDWQTLAVASEARVLKHWEGLGYYRRARNLHHLAQTIISNHGGQLPSQRDDLLQLPGIGPYTAAAIASISFHQAVPVVDGNVERVLSRVFALTDDITHSATKKKLWSLAGLLLNHERPGDYNQALMELGALICTPTKPQCLLCPLNKVCRAPDPEKFPVKTRQASVLESEKVSLIRQEKKIWLMDKETPGRWQGFHRLPLFNPHLMKPLRLIGTHRYGITKYRITAEVWLAKWKQAPKDGIWVDTQELLELSLPAPHRKILTLLP